MSGVGAGNDIEARWVRYGSAIYAGIAGGERGEYQLEALLSVRRALASTTEPTHRRHRVAKACRWDATHLVRARVRRERMERRWRLLGHGHDMAHTNHTIQADASRGATVASAVRGLVASEHPAVLRYAIGDMSDVVAAGCLGISPSGLRSRVGRIREKMRAA